MPPRPADEQVLMVWDQKTQVEHFVRQVRFSDAKEPFGFVVPTPSRPTLHEIDQEPWDLLVGRCNPKWSGSGMGFGIGLGSIGAIGHGLGGGGRGLGAPPPVTVLEEKQLGDFKAFVLEANDAKGFSAWLKKNQFKSTPELEAWLNHYIELKFYFVALRYEGSKKQAPKPGEEPQAELISKTVHISFKTANPYYPYLEPLAPKGTDRAKERKLQVWFVSDWVMQPVARYWGEGEASGSLVRPWTEAYPCDGAVEDLGKQLKGVLGESTSGKKRLQVFADLKTSREGYGDVLLVPPEPHACSIECMAQRGQLAKLLEADAELKRETKPVPGGAPAPYLAPASCSQQPRRGGPIGWLWLGLPLLGVGVGIRRRRWARLLGGAGVCALMLLGCEKTGTPSAATSDAPSEPPAVQSSKLPTAVAPTNSVAEPALDLPDDPAAAHSKLVTLLEGRLGGLRIPVQATDARTGIGAVVDSLPEGLPSAGVLAKQCLPGTNVESVIRVEINREALVQTPEVLGPLSEPAKKCLAQSIQVAQRDAPKAGVERFVLGIGPSTPQQKQLQQRFGYSLGFTGGTRLTAVRIRMAGLEVAGRLPKEVVQRVQRRHFARYRSCVERDKQKALKELTVSYVIDPQGQVKNVRSKPDGGEAGSCMRKAFAAALFPKPEGGVVRVSTKFSFEHPK